MKNNKEITTLAIDTSCDETSVAVVKNRTVLANIMPSQMEYHAKFGGVVPSLAKLGHQERIDNVVIQTLKRAKVSMEQIDIIAVTYGPGLAIALEVGMKKAKDLALTFNKPLFAINHMEGHLLSSLLLPNGIQLNNVQESFPALGFLISGGHTELVLVNGIGNYQKIGETVDDSCGEAYDKCGRILGFGYPAGPIISKLAKENRKNFQFKIAKDNLSVKVICTNKMNGKSLELPVPMVNSGNLNMSYSGLKTAFKQLVESLIRESKDKSLSKEEVIHLCVVFEAAAIEQLKFKLKKALETHKIKQLWLGGGVVASAKLRQELRGVAKNFGVKTLFPYSNKLTGDNASMIGIVANLKVLSMGLENIVEDLDSNIFTKSFEKLDRDPSLSL